MQMKLAIIFAVAALSVPGFAATEHKGNTADGAGTLGAPVVVGANISVNAETLVSGKSADVVCQIDAYTATQSGSDWTCSKGDRTGVFVDGVKVSDVLTGQMESSCYPNGIATVCLYKLLVYTPKGAVVVTASGDQYIGTVTLFDGVW